MAYISTFGYVMVHRPDHPRSTPSGYVAEHILIAEKALGRFINQPEEVHHFSEVKHENDNGNLVICENRKYHMLLHARARVLRAGGDPNTDKICSACKKPLPFCCFSSNKSNYDGMVSTCSPCRSKSRNKTTRHRAAWLTEFQREAIRLERAGSGAPLKTIAAQFGISPSCVRNALSGFPL